ncbi:MAG: glycosyltransferase [Pseudomonadota bacterium]
MAGRFNVVIPAYQAKETLGRCLKGLIDGGVDRQQIIVVDDGSPDESGQIAKAAGVTVIRNETSLRPAKARNRGVELCQEEIVVFVDADVVPHPEAAQRLVAAFDDPSISAVFGSYDDKPEAPSVVSRYRNLLHFHVHQNTDPEAETFWTGLGAVRRNRFSEVGELDSDWENIEDVEFGLRLRAAGDRIRLIPEAQGSHLKDWTLGSMFKTDLFGRAVPWTRLIQAGRMPPSTLNGSMQHRLSALCVLGLLFAVFGALWAPMLLLLALIFVCLFIGINAKFLAVLYRAGGLRLAIGALPFHAIHYVAALLGYAKVRLGA